jgi:catechol 2,3-dioxygenase-like lactoylglutathione lyase family enzyme
MLDHLEINVADLERSAAFYRAALAPLGYDLRVSAEGRGFGVDARTLDFWLRRDEPARPPPHFAFNCANRALARRAHEAAVGAGGIDAGSPRLLPHIHANYFAGFVLDPDGHKVEFVCHAPE